ncbi:MAG: hypothetical protein OXF41_12905 [bacterium]|nr:hypothetical protein [bacterium]
MSRLPNSDQEGYDNCYRCSGQPVSVVPISLSIHGRLLHHHLRSYKDGPHSIVREKFTLRLAAILEVFLSFHLDGCLGGPVHRVATVPSEKRDAPWGIIKLLRRFAGQTNPLSYDRRRSRYVVTTELRNQRVLLVDDTFTTGRSIFDAYHTLTNAGAVAAGPVVLGRHIRPDWEPSKALLQRLEPTQWRPTECCRCAGELFNPPLRDTPPQATSLFDS